MACEPRGFAVRLLVRIAAIATVATGVGWLFVLTELRVVPLALAAVGCALVAELLRFQRRASEQLARVLAAWHAGDLADRVRAELPAPGFADVEAALERIRERLQATTRAIELRARYLAQVLDHAPIALLAVEPVAGRITPLNMAARRLVGHAREVGVAELASLGAAFARDLLDTPVGSRRLTHAVLDEPHALVVSVGAFTSDGRMQRLISLQDIQGELDRRALEAWQDMAQVLAHEITGSLTPVASLSAIAADRLAEIDPSPLAPADQKLVAEAREASAVTARRSEGLMRFASRYREFAALPPPQRERIELGELFDRIRDLFARELAGITFVVEAPQPPIRLTADRTLLEQALINLVRNAASALAGRPAPAVWVRGRTTAAGRAALEVSDNGPGVPAELVERIFVPFFTTRDHGTGLGLPLVRLIAQAHGGAITVTERIGGGATFTLTL